MPWPWIRLIAIIAVMALVSIYDRSVFSDDNVFLKDFLDNDLLSVLGFVTAVTLASAASIHLQLNSLEIQRGQEFSLTKDGLRRSSLTLIFAFFISLVIVVLKPVFHGNEWVQIAANIGGLTMVIVSLEVLWDITVTTFRIPSKSLMEQVRLRYCSSIRTGPSNIPRQICPKQI